MKKLLCLLTAAVITLSVTACSVSDVALPEYETSHASLDQTTGESEPAQNPAETIEPDTSAASAEAAQPAADTETAPAQTAAPDENGTYTTRDDVALYIHLYGHLPYNFITKKQAQELGWNGGSLEPYAPGMCIGGSRFGNYEGLLPDKDGRTYTECDIDTLGADSRGAKRIVFSNDGLIYYTDDHYESFTLLYGEE